MSPITNDPLPVDPISDSVLDTVMMLRYLKENGARSHEEKNTVFWGRPRIVFHRVYFSILRLQDGFNYK